MAIFQRFKNWLSEPIDGQVLGLFRLVYGLFMIYNTYYYYDIDLIGKGLLAPKILFKYEGLEWLHPLSEPAMYAVLGLMGLSAMCIAAGVLFRWACWVFALSLSFIFFQEKSYYNNHIYLFILLAPLLSATHADRFLSLRSKFGRTMGGKIPRWEQFIIQAQFVIVYFYGGIVKMKADWLVRKEPVTSLVGYLPADHWLSPLLKNDFGINLLTYGGFLLDILAPLLLWHKGIRRWAIIPFVGFHLANSRIFTDIGIFPYVMLGALIIFYETNELPWLRKLSERLSKTAASKKGEQIKQPSESLPSTPLWVKYTLIGYFTFQLLFPFRGFFLPNQLDYTTMGNRFSWRMKADTRLTDEVKFFVQDPISKQESPVDIRTFINDMQVNSLSMDPRSVSAFSRYLKSEVAKYGMPNAIVKARIRIRYNGRPQQDFVKPDVDLATVPCSAFQKLNWVVEPSK